MLYNRFYLKYIIINVITFFNIFLHINIFKNYSRSHIYLFYFMKTKLIYFNPNRLIKNLIILYFVKLPILFYLKISFNFTRLVNFRYLFIEVAFKRVVF